MPQEPKKRHSRQRQGKRRASIHLATPKGVVCPNCGTISIPHTVCKQCGYYDGRQVLAVKQKEKSKAIEKTA